jgi:hypothetical protein
MTHVFELAVELVRIDQLGPLLENKSFHAVLVLTNELLRQHILFLHIRNVVISYFSLMREM